MAQKQNQKKSGGNRKIGRHDRSPSMQAYNSGLRDLVNKRRKAMKHMKNSAKKPMAVPRGTARRVWQARMGFTV